MFEACHIAFVVFSHDYIVIFDHKYWSFERPRHEAPRFGPRQGHSIAGGVTVEAVPQTNAPTPINAAFPSSPRPYASRLSPRTIRITP
jgi:hypothetical protein